MVTVILPWRATHSREPAYEFVTGWYRRSVPDAVILPVDSDDEQFNLARCRNVGIQLIDDPDEVVVISDADTFPEAAPLRAAIAQSASSGLVHLPYTEYHWLGARGTDELLSGTAAAECDFELVRGARSGVYVTTPRTWWAHGGQDERFRGWGFEDAAWYLAHGALLGAPPRRHPGRVFAMHHATQLREGPQYERNAALAERYRAAVDDPVLMRQLVEEERTAESAANARSLPGVF
ncbi:hypothetical protein BH10ACT6_BH10ACT6_02020 [soil metagenome]